MAPVQLQRLRISHGFWNILIADPDVSETSSCSTRSLGLGRRIRKGPSAFRNLHLTFQSRLSAGTKKAIEGSCGNLTACAVKVYPNKVDGRTACRDISWERDHCAQVHNPCDVAALPSVLWLHVFRIAIIRIRVTVGVAHDEGYF